ncbi:hypothetical protein BSG1_02745 [Bacillus sp. SG-1]|nr:hypothetical protein BSG1_02745 [Bacillus sp. SG-1]
MINRFPLQACDSAGRAVSLLGFACGVTFQWVRNLGLTCHQKWKRPVQARQANVPERKKVTFPFILSGLFDPEGLGAGTRRPARPAGGRTPSAPI